MARQCAVDGCERTPSWGWARCDSHVRQWLDRLLGVEWRECKDSSLLNWGAHLLEDAHLEEWAPGELLEVFGR